MSFGVQPARDELAQQGLTITAAATKLGENRGHLNKALLEYVAPAFLA